MRIPPRVASPSSGSHYPSLQSLLPWHRRGLSVPSASGKVVLVFSQEGQRRLWRDWSRQVCSTPSASRSVFGFPLNRFVVNAGKRVRLSSVEENEEEGKKTRSRVAPLRFQLFRFVPHYRTDDQNDGRGCFAHHVASSRHSTTNLALFISSSSRRNKL